MMQEPELPYAHRLKTHLASYKHTILGLHEDGIWSRNGRCYPHILPARHRDFNFLAPLRSEILGYLAHHNHIRLHRDFHHLNSSQAMCMNLMYPVVVSERARASLGVALDLQSEIDASSARFEWMPDAIEGTNFDFFIRTAAGGNVFFEFKLTEAEFGTARADDRHLAKLKDIYAARLLPLVGSHLLEPEAFFSRYQLLRNLSYFATPNDALVLVVPRAHVKLANQARTFMADLPDAVRQRVRLAYMDDIAGTMRPAVADDPPALHAHLNEFTAKYCIQ